MLKVENIKVNYGNVVGIHDISLNVKEGEIVTLIGANGAGKTTILKTISGLLKPKHGLMSFCNEKINGYSTSGIVKLGISHCPEGRGIWPDMTVYEHMEMGSYLRKDSNEIEKDLTHIYEYFPLIKERRTQHAGSLSGGQQQMVAIGRALMSRPRLLLLDEPSLGLAPNLVIKVAEIIKQIREDGVAVLLVEQNALLALSISDRGYVIEKGKVLLEGTADELIKNEKIQEAYLGQKRR